MFLEGAVSLTVSAQLRSQALSLLDGGKRERTWNRALVVHWMVGVIAYWSWAIHLSLLVRHSSNQYNGCR